MMELIQGGSRLYDMTAYSTLFKERLMRRAKWLFILLVPLLTVLFSYESSYACGGLFCQNSPVDQNAERIIFTQNDDGTITTLVEIQYTGSAPDFSWILPIPSAISAEDLAVPETGVEALDELETLTAPVIIPPPLPRCAQIVLEDMFMAEGAAVPSSVEVFATGEVGPFSFDVIGSEDPTALISWLRDNDYRVTQEMEPLINVYVEEEFAFLAMQLLPEETVDSIKPIQITYEGELPMIPLRLTAVAANPDMRILTWVFADEQAIPTNYGHFEIPDRDITFFTFGGNNYRQLIGEYADQFDGKGFITEYAAPASELAVVDPLLLEYVENYDYVTRLSTVISPEEMTIDPVFDYDPQRPDVSNIRDLSNERGLYDCEKEQRENLESAIDTINIFSGSDDSDDTVQVEGQSASDPLIAEEDTPSSSVLTAVVGLGVLIIVSSLAFTLWKLQGRKES